MFALVYLSMRAQIPQIKWYYDTYDASYGQSAAGDIDLDGKLEIVFGCYRNDSSVYALNAEDGTLLWKYNTHPNGYEGCNDAAPIIYDIDGDDSLEVIVPGSCNPTTFCFRGSNGTVKWQTPSAGSDSPPTIGDIDNDGILEVLHGGFDGHVLCINGQNGVVKWSLAVDENSWIQTAPTIVDLDGNGQLDFVVATWAFSGDTSRVYAYRGNDHSLLWQHSIPDVMYHGTAVSDLDGDGQPELVIGSYNGKLYCLNGADGNEKWVYTYSPSSFYYVGAPASIADLNNDGKCETLFVNSDEVVALTDTGSLLWHYTIPGYGTAFRGAAIADINGDNMPDVVFGTSNGSVTVLNGTNGSMIWKYDLAAHYGKAFEIDHAPLIADFDNDGTIDVFIVGGHGEYPNFQNDYGRAYMLSAGIGSGPPWLMFQHDIRRQSSLCGVSAVSIPEHKSENRNPFAIYPNPASNTIEITGLENGTTEIFTLQGQIVKIIPISNLKTVIDISNLAAGVYLIRAKNENGISSRLLKIK